MYGLNFLCLLLGDKMFEVRLYEGSYCVDCQTCDVGNLLPTIATLLQAFEAKKPTYDYQRPYSIQWKRIKE